MCPQLNTIKKNMTNVILRNQKITRRNELGEDCELIFSLREKNNYAQGNVEILKPARMVRDHIKYIMYLDHLAIVTCITNIYLIKWLYLTFLLINNKTPMRSSLKCCTLCLNFKL